MATDLLDLTADIVIAHASVTEMLSDDLLKEIPDHRGYQACHAFCFHDLSGYPADDIHDLVMVFTHNHT